MRIEQIGAYGYGVQVAKVKQREQSEESEKRHKKSRFSRQDTYEAAGVVGKASSINEVKKRIKSDFYNSEVVNDDLSDVFSKLLDR
jgi:hypothetical protein